MTRPLALACFVLASFGALTKASAEAGPTQSEQHVQRAEAYARAGSDVLAESHYREAVHADPRNLAAYLGLTRILVRMSRPEEALEVVRVAIGIDPGHIELADLASTLLLEAGDFREAMRPLTTACRARPTAACFERLADVAERAGAHPEALTALRRARALGTRTRDVAPRIAMLEGLIGPLVSSVTGASASRPASPGPQDGSQAPSPGCSGTPPIEAR